MLSRSSLRLVLKLFNNYYNFLATKRVPGNKTGPIDYLGQPVSLFGREFIENQKKDSINAGLERGARY